MARVERKPIKLKKRAARASAAQLRSLTAPPKVEAAPRPIRSSGGDAVRRPVRTAMTPRPELAIPAVSVENVDWEDGSDPVSPLDLWEQSERHLERRLAELGIEGKQRSRFRFDAKEGRAVWFDDAHVTLAEGRAQLLATWVESGSRLVMAWADPAVAAISVPPIEDMGDSLLVDRPTARELALRALEVSGADFIVRIGAPHGEHYLAIRGLRPSSVAPVTPGSPVGMVLRGLADIRRSVGQRDEPTDVLRARFLSLGKTILAQADAAYRDTEWVGRLERAGRVLTQLGARLIPPTFSAIAAGRQADEWLAQSVAVELGDAIKLLEDEWGAFA